MTFHELHSDMREPEKFTFPFCYKPHPLCMEAAREVCGYIAGHDEIRRDADRGKMFGVLVVRDAEGRRGFLAAYSGLLAGRNDWDFFVPPVFDSQRPDGYFKSREAEITAINGRISALEHSSELAECAERLESCRRETEASIAAYKAKMEDARHRREEKRRTDKSLSTAEAEAMTRESQFMKAELRRMKQRGRERLSAINAGMEALTSAIDALKCKRKEMSDDLQRWLFGQYVMLNARGEGRDLCSIFADTRHGLPPAGAGDCCAPKLLQHAYRHGLHPVCMAEFWWGESPRSEVRHHLHYYPACRGKCKPILGHMLQGLDVDDDPQQEDTELPLETVYEDRWIAVVCKPAGMLSVPGKSERRSVLSIMRGRCPEADGPMIVHRLDMDTSGLMIIAKDKDTHARLQAQFIRREITKRYVALLEGTLPAAKGTICLPLRADPFDRPLQKIDRRDGKVAVTEYETLGDTGGHTRVALCPLTGRTHQLRVHCAHADGLGMPILGDSLYGHGNGRLHLHAEAIAFTHPVTNEKMYFKREADF